MPTSPMNATSFVYPAKRIIHHHLQFWKILGTDILFFTLFYMLSVRLDLFMGPSEELNFAVGIGYLFVAIIGYSVAKYFIMLKVIKILTDKQQLHSWTNLKEFFLLNFLLF